jgi:hypothetical protein
MAAHDNFCLLGCEDKPSLIRGHKVVCRDGSSTARKSASARTNSLCVTTRRSGAWCAFTCVSPCVSVLGVRDHKDKSWLALMIPDRLQQEGKYLHAAKKPLFLPTTNTLAPTRLLPAKLRTRAQGILPTAYSIAHHLGNITSAPITHIRERKLVLEELVQAITALEKKGTRFPSDMYLSLALL